MLMKMNTPLTLKNHIQKYAWGSHTAIQQLMNQPATEEPWAELWMGAHPKAPSEVYFNSRWHSLPDFIQRFPEDILGLQIAHKHGNTLPYLFKILAAASPLSIQAHPNARQAKEGFERESAGGTDIHSPTRNYRDPNHKPECICALTPFTGLKGFREIDVAAGLLASFCPRSLSAEIKLLEKKNFQHFFKAVMELPPSRIDEVITEALKNADIIQTPDLICKWIRRLYHHYPADIGVISPLFLNLFRLEPGQALFLPAGELHAYLDGLGIELMASSDNVLRGGLTPKHVDVPELLNVLNFDATGIDILTPRTESLSESRYPVCAEEFQLSDIRISDSAPYACFVKHSVEILLCTRGTAVLQSDEDKDIHVTIKQGDSVLIPSALKTYRLYGSGDFYKAGIPLDFKRQGD